jgi:hypothetical protein
VRRRFSFGQSKLVVVGLVVCRQVAADGEERIAVILRRLLPLLV